MIEEQKKALQERKMDPDVLESLKNFQSVINMLYERSGRIAFEKSF